MSGTDLKKITPWLLGALVAAYIISGFGITEYRTVEPLTFGLLSKALSFQIHNALIIPFLLVLLLHLYIVLNKKNGK